LAQASEISSQALGPTKPPLRLSSAQASRAQQPWLNGFGLGLAHHYVSVHFWLDKYFDKELFYAFTG